MSSNRRFECDKGPDLEESDQHDGDGDADEGATEPAESGRPTGIAVAPWNGGLVAGVSAFAAMGAAVAVVPRLAGTTP